MTKPLSPFALPEPWDLVASGYADEAPMVMQPFSIRAAELAGLTKDSVVADVACGPGPLSLNVAPDVARVWALDFSPPMLDRLVAAAKERGLNNIEVTCGDGQSLPQPDESFDAAFSLFGLMFFPDRRKGFRELFRILRPSGTAIVSSWAPVAESPLMMLMFGALRAADPTRPVPQYDPSSLENPEVFEEEMRAAGFSEIRIVKHTTKIVVSDAAELWHKMTRSSAPLVLLRKNLGEATWQTQAERALLYLEAEIARVGTTLSTTAFLASGRKIPGTRESGMPTPPTAPTGRGTA